MAWGDNFYGQLGIGTNTHNNSLTLVNCSNTAEAVDKGMITAGDTRQENGEYILTPAENNKSGAIWSTEKIDLSENVHIDAEIYLGDKDAGADGMALVFQHEGNGLVGQGGWLGYKGITPSLIIEFDTYQNNIPGEDFKDPVQDHVGIHIDGHAKHDANEKYKTVGNLENGQYHKLSFSWNAKEKTFSLILDGGTIFKDEAFPDDVLLNGTDKKVYWGFTAATGPDLSNEHKVKITRLLSY